MTQSWVDEIKDKGRRFDEVSQEAARLREDMDSLRGAMSAQTEAQQHLSKEHMAEISRLPQDYRNQVVYTLLNQF